MGILNSIRNQPDNQKKIVSLVLAVILTAIIVSVWFTYSDKGENKIASEEPNKLSSVSPFQMIKEEFSKAFSGFKEMTSSTTEEIISTSTVQIEIIEATSTATSTN